jgi:DNA-binding response OmpR family regulator
MSMRNLMVVDDEPEILETLALIFEPRGWKVAQCSGGERCLEALRSGFQGVILLDIMMPGMNGWQTLRAIREGDLLGKSLVFMLTALSEPGAEARGLEEMVHDYITKPFETSELVAFVTDAADSLLA